jgi:hypothetical protein
MLIEGVEDAALKRSFAFGRGQLVVSLDGRTVQVKEDGIEQLIGSELILATESVELIDEMLRGLLLRFVEVAGNDALQLRELGLLYFQSDTTAQEWAGKLAFAVTGEDDKRKLAAMDVAVLDAERGQTLNTLHHDIGFVGAGELRDRVFAFFKDVEEVVGQVEIALVDFVDEKGAGPFRLHHGDAERAEGDEITDGGVGGTRILCVKPP